MACGDSGINFWNKKVSRTASKDKNAEPDAFSGSYDVTGPDYTAVLKIKKSGQGYHLEWEMPGGTKYYGKGIERDGILGAVYDMGNGVSSGVVAYRKIGKGISGIWTTPAGKDLMFEKTVEVEELSASHLDLRGTYNVKGMNEDSTEYAGKLEISESGSVLAAEWMTGNTFINGTGFVLDDVLVLGFGDESGIGIAVYEIHGTTLDGYWLSCPYSDLSTSYPLSLNREKALK